AATAPCTTEDTATVTVTIQDAPEAGTSGTLTVCEGTTITDAMLFAELTGADEGGTWSEPVDGVYTYTVEATGTCTEDASATVKVSVDAAPNAGTNGTLTVCEGTQVTNEMLFAQLGGSPNAGGTWSTPVDGVYTYTVEATGTCTEDASATVTVSVDAAPNAGTNGTLTVCEGTQVTNEMLFVQLGGSPNAGGTWSTPVDGVYTYTVEATGTCTEDASATVTVSVDAAPNAGTNGTLTVCEGTEITNEMLFAQLGGADAGGTWSTPVDGVYTYTVEATGTCTQDASATVTVSVDAAPNAGTNGTLTVCEGTQVTNEMLFAQLGGADAGGTWSEPVDGVYTYTVEATGTCTQDASATVTVSVDAAPNAGTNGTLTVCEGTEITNEMLFAQLGGADAGGAWSEPVDGVYTYTVEAIGTCIQDASATVTVSVDAAPNAGTNGTLTVCEGTEITNEMLFAQLGGSPNSGGTWSTPVDGVYTYTVEATGTCTQDASATVTVSVDAAPNAGTNGTLTVCEGTQVTNEMLFAQLGGADAGGTWSEPVDGVYIYTVAAIGTCTEDASATVTVSVDAAPNAGTNGTLTVCEGTQVTNEMLFAQLGGSPNADGTWSTPVDGVYTYTVEATGTCTEDASATVTVSVDAAPNAGTNGTLTVCEGTQVTNEMLFVQLGGSPNAGGTWSTPVDGVYTYTVEATGTCTEDASATVTVSVDAAPNAGTNGTLTVCEGTQVTNEMLFAQLGGSPNADGTWSTPVDGVYTYTVEATGTCTEDASATVTVSVDAAPNAGTNGTLTVCEGTQVTNEMLFAQLGGADAGGTWSTPVDGVYTYTVEATGTCTQDASATVTVTTQQATAPTVESISQPTCEVATGSFSITAVEGMIYSFNGGEFGTTTSWTELAADTYTVVAKNAAGCQSEPVIVTINDQTEVPAAPVIEELLQPTCEDQTGFVMFQFVDGVDFVLTDSNGNEINDEDADGIFEGLAPGAYTSTASNGGGCISEGTEFTIENPVPAVIQTTTADLCIEDSTFELTDLFVGDYDTNGTWEDTMNTGALNNGVIDPALLAVGQYSFDYVITNGECSSTTTVEVSINDDCVVLPCEVEDIRNSISKAVTPNGDQINDFFEVGKDLGCGFTYTLKVFNRWGNEVYSSNNYNNNWDGTSSSSVTGDQLPSGTYFYIVEIQQSGFEPIQGYIYLGTK
uniref:T9SS type B sorting domain-containing protein n=1 Tax=Salinimicrobium sp. HB62 TaxID=3077781 RepID=UPI002D79C452